VKSAVSKANWDGQSNEFLLKVKSEPKILNVTDATEPFFRNPPAAAMVLCGTK